MKNENNNNNVRYGGNPNRESWDTGYWKKREEQDAEADEKVVFEGNAFYEIDLKCVRERQKKS